MGRELRRVPADWEHPRKSDGRFQPMYDQSYREAAEHWVAEFRKFVPNEYAQYFWDWGGMPPDPNYYRPDWGPEERTHFQMYENTSEGTPISPVFADVESLCRWLAETGASSFAGMTASYESWMAVCKSARAPSAVVVNGTLVDGVSFAGGEL